MTSIQRKENNYGSTLDAKHFSAKHQVPEQIETDVVGNEVYDLYANTNFRKRIHFRLRKTSHVARSSFSRAELQRALPRTSFFSCHEKAVKDAGNEGYANSEPKGTKLLNKTNRSEPLPLMESEETNPATSSEFQSSIQNIITDVSNVCLTKTDKQTTESYEIIVPQVENSDNTERQASNPVKVQPNSSKKKRPETAKFEYIDCKPLLSYLEYIKENKEEYIHYLQTLRPAEPVQLCSNSLIKLGRAFELRNHGGSMKKLENDAVVLAAKALRPRTADPDKFNKQRQGHIQIQEPNTSKIRPDEKHNRDKPLSVLLTVKEEDTGKTELEKKRLRAEDWCRTVSTNTLNMAKSQTLRELGSDDTELTNWLETFKKCHYLRQTRFQ